MALIGLIMTLAGLSISASQSSQPASPPAGVEITHCDVSVTPDFDKDTIAFKACCTLRNGGPDTVANVDFDVLADGKRSGVIDVEVEIVSVTRDVNGRAAKQAYTHAAAADPAREDTVDTPKPTRVALSPPLGPGAEANITFEYNLRDTASQREMNYRLLAALPDGGKEICLLDDYAWMPRLYERDKAKVGKTNWFPKLPMPTWTVQMATPAGYEGVVLSGRCTSTRQQDGQTVSQWESRSPGLPVLMMGRFERVTVKRGDISVIFFVPKTWKSRKNIEFHGDALANAYQFYSKLYGPLNGNEIQVGLSSAGQGSHGAYLGMVLDCDALANRVVDTPAHELAHSWWGHSVCSYGRGTKFLRESLANFSCFEFQDKALGAATQALRISGFASNLTDLFRRSAQGKPLFYPDGDDEGLAYTKGPLILNVLRSEMGEEVFFNVLRTFATRYRGKYVTFDDFLATCNEVSGQDWKAFFDQWCYGEGCPDYRLTSFNSIPTEGKWKTTVTIQNVGKGIVSCPLELRMEKQAQRQTFRVKGGASESFSYETADEVKKVVIDPDHTAYQGNDQDWVFKALAIGKTDWEWMKYWRGVAYAKLGQYDEAIQDIAAAMSSHGHPGFSYSRGIVYLLRGNAEAARSDLADFIDWVVAKQNRDSLGTVAYAGVISSGGGSSYLDDLNMILKSLTRKDFHTLDEWESWWERNKASFDLAPSASTLPPDGVRGRSRKTTHFR